MSDARANILRISKARKSFGSDEVLHSISLSVDTGEVVAIIGPSGSGKSTLLRCATLLEQLDGGSLYYDGEAIASGEDDGPAVYASAQVLQSARMKFGLVFQDFNLFPHYTVMKNITDPPLHVQKRNREDVFAEAQTLLEKMGLEDKGTSLPCELSGGQQQRVSIARALALNPKILYFDEPTSALDPELTAEILRVIRALAAEHMTMVIVTHEMSFAREVADRILFMDSGVIVEEGPAEQLVDHPRHERLRAFLNKLET
ncbi:MAG: amino acid ABC transporter ATP-binding protein [Coriobacteriales bacterium]|jgi:polar amino acid transport system ATP-binding protein|nr:amino acid ABC transporter ATP-binding protein [Coriobacteriales bacterium]